MNEISIQNEIRLALSKAGILSFRNNTGALKDKTGRLVIYGLCPGSSDVIGINPVKITPAMVGEVIGQFVAIEVKTKRGKPSEKQLNFIDAINKKGGKAGVARSPEEAINLMGECV